jgi:hypothetical protein
MLIKGALNMKEKLTERFLKTIIPQKRPYEVVDSEINGFKLRVQLSGVLAYKAVLSKAVNWGWLELSHLTKLKPLKTDDWKIIRRYIFRIARRLKRN